MTNMVRVSFRIHPDTRDVIEKEAAKRGLVPSDMFRMIINAGIPVIQGQTNEPETLKETNELLKQMLRIMSGKDKEYAETRKEGFR